MTTILRLFWILGIILLADPFFGSNLPKVFASMPEGRQELPVRRALLMGIGDYQVLPDLPGAHNDISLVRHILTDRFGFSPNNVEVLTDSEATRTGILHALDRLVEQTGEQDMVYFHYSGHGSQVKDLNGDEQDDQLDETIVPADGRTKGIPDITDDQLEGYFGRLKTPHAVLVFDSCHSGTVTRGVAVQTRFVPPDTRIGLYQHMVSQTRGVVPLLSQRYVLMTGAASNQPALDGPIHGNYHGFFTYSLFQSLIATPLNATTEVVFGKLQVELGHLKNYLGRSYMPEPQLEAPKARLNQPLFTLTPSETADSRKYLPPDQLAWFKVKLDREDGPRLIGGGREGGRGTVWALYPPNTKSFTPEKAVAYGMTVKRKGLDAIVRVDPPSVSIPDNSRAIVLAKPPGSGTVRVQFRDVPSHQKGQLEEALHQQLSELRVVQSDESTQYVIDMSDDQFQVLSGDGLEEVATFPRGEGKQIPVQLADFFSRSLHVNELLALENPSSHIVLNTRIVQPGHQGISVIGKEAHSETYSAHIRRKGDSRSSLNSLQIELQTNVDCYVTIVDIDSEGAINVLFPNSYQKRTFYPDGFIRKEAKVVIPDSLNKTNQAGFHWDFADPAGVDTIRIFASTDLEIARTIRNQLNSVNAKMLVVTRGGGSTSQTVITGLRKLRGELVGALTRGIVIVPDDVGSKTSKAGFHTAIRIPSQKGTNGSAESLGSMDLTQEIAPDWTAKSITIRIQP